MCANMYYKIRCKGLSNILLFFQDFQLLSYPSLSYYYHATESLYSNSASIACWLQSTSAKLRGHFNIHNADFFSAYLIGRQLDRMGIILVNSLLLKIFILIIVTYRSSCISALQDLCELSDRRYSARVMPKM